MTHPLASWDGSHAPSVWPGDTEKMRSAVWEDARPGGQHSTRHISGGLGGRQLGLLSG